MIKITERNEKLEELIQNNNKAFVFKSIIEGNTSGSIYIDNVQNPECYVVFDGGNFTLFFGGEPSRESEYANCIAYIRNEILTEEMKEEQDEWILIVFESEKWKEKLEKGLKGLRIEYDRRTLFKYPLTVGIDDERTFKVNSIDNKILNDDNLGNIELLREEIEDIWGGSKNFIKSGFGVCTLDGNKITAYCTAKFISSKECGIGIYTLEEYRNKGIARCIAKEFVREAKKRNITPYWDAWTLNLPSAKVADRANFKKLEEYSVMVVQF